MDTRSNEPPAAMAQQKSFRPPLVTSEKSNAVLENRKVRLKEVASRYKSAAAPGPVSASSTPKRSPSSSAGRTSPAPAASAQKRAQSAERKRPSSAPSTRPSSPSARQPSPSSQLSAVSSPSSRPSSPLARQSSPSSRLYVVSSPSSRPSSPSARQPSPSSRLSTVPSPSSRPTTPSSPSSRSTTPVRDSIVETRNSSRISLGGRDGLWPSMRSLSASFQSDSSSLFTSKRDRVIRNPSPDAKLKSSVSAVPERRSPLRGRNISDQSENSRPVENSHARMIDQHRWPGIGKMSARAMSKSVDLTDKVNRSSSLSIPTRGISPTRRMPLSDTVGSSLQKSVNEAPRMLLSERSRVLERDTCSGVNVSSHPSEKAQLAIRPSRTQLLPVPGLHRPSSPSKALLMSSSVSRGMQSPSRTRPSTPASPSRTRTSTPVSPSRTRPSTPVSPTSSTASRADFSSSVFNYIADVRTGKKSANHMEDAYQLRLLYNRDLQWRFVNAQADASLSTQTITAENSLFSVWSITSELHDSVIAKRTNLQKLKQEKMLDLILNEQIAYLEEWTSLETEHSSCLSGAIEALKASTLRLPVTGGARADVRAVKNAVSSAVDVMQAMGSSICYLLSRLEGANHLVSELCSVATKERDMLEECRELLASTAAMQVQECSLRAHVVQLRQDVM